MRRHLLAFIGPRFSLVAFVEERGDEEFGVQFRLDSLDVRSSPVAFVEGLIDEEAFVRPGSRFRLTVPAAGSGRD